MVNQVIAYIIAVLADRYGIQLHALCVMSNHTHDVATDPYGNIVEFQRDCHALIARHINAIYGDFESIWAREPTCRLECAEAVDVFDKIVYTMNNPVKARLVAHGKNWPGLRGAWPQKPRIIRRPKGFFRGSHDGGAWPERATLTFSRPPGREDLADDELALTLRDALGEQEQRVRHTVQAEGKRFIGRRAVLAQSRYAYPHSQDTRGNARPQVAARSKWARIEKLRNSRAWLDAYDAAKQRLKDGCRDVLFPYGTYKLRVYYRIACQPPPA